MTRDTELNFNAAKFVATEKGIWSNTILLGTVGSTVHGTNVQDGVEDLDLMGVCIEPMRCAIGFREFEQFIYRTAAARASGHPEANVAPHNARSMAGDVDLTIYSLRKYLRLALKGNPTILTLLFTPVSSLHRFTGFGDQLRQRTELIVSKRAGGAYLGYMQAQRQRLTGERGGRHGSRPELTNQYGYDSKYAAHVLRLGYQGIELMTTEKLILPMEELERDSVLAMRRGEVPREECFNRLEAVEKLLKLAIEDSPLRAEPDTEAVEQWMLDTYRLVWGSCPPSWLARQRVNNEGSILIDSFGVHI
jgi:hypothetical protein